MEPATLKAALYFCACAILLATVRTPPSAAQTVETPQQANDRIRSLAAASRVPPPSDYVIGTGDLVSVQVFDVPELNRELRVSQTGTIGIPLVPVRLHLAGLTELQAERKIAEVLEANGLVSHPEVSVTVKEKKSKPITIVGAVPHPMVYAADRQVTLIEALAEAGGISGDAGDHVIITRAEPAPADSNEPPAIGPNDVMSPGGQALTPPPSHSSSRPAESGADSSAQQAAALPGASNSSSRPAAQADPPQLAPTPATSTITVNLNQILETGNLSSNVILVPGDVVTVPHAGIVYVLGAVSRPGGYTVNNDRAQLTTLKVLSLAGGLNHTAKSARAYIVRKDDAGKQSEVEVDLSKVMKFQSEDVQLRPSDILYVPTSGAKTAMVRAAEIGLAVGTGLLLYRVAYH
jgi:polysaccharide biosynthesis/export protein